MTAPEVLPYSLVVSHAACQAINAVSPSAVCLGLEDGDVVSPTCGIAKVRGRPDNVERKRCDGQSADFGEALDHFWMTEAKEHQPDPAGVLAIRVHHAGQHALEDVRAESVKEIEDQIARGQGELSARPCTDVTSTHRRRPRKARMLALAV